MGNDKVIFTCLSSSQARLLEPLQTDRGWDYWCFTKENTSTLGSKKWQPVQIPQQWQASTYWQLAVKMRSLELLPTRHQIAIYIAPNILIRGDLNGLIDKAFHTEADFASLRHSGWNCAYQEAAALMQQNKYTETKVKKVLQTFHKDGFPQNEGLLSSFLMIYRCHNQAVQQFCQQWWHASTHPDGIDHDQLTFPYLLWKNRDVKFTYLEPANVLGTNLEWLPPV